MTENFDVVIIGGGPAGSTVGAVLKTYDQDLKVLILEKDEFPREHVGESQLPPIGKILNEIGCYDKVEAANFPIKVGASLRWGNKPEIWDFHFIPKEEFIDIPRPAKYEGQRMQTAFQVDRAIYDKILLDHCESLGCVVEQPVQVSDVFRAGDKVEGLKLKDGREINARYYVDATGNNGLLRNKMEVELDEPTALRNVAFWDYWENAEWEVEIGVGGTRVQIMSIHNGWLWFIPLSPTRTSVGFICPAEYHKSSGKTPEQAYLQAIADEPVIRKLTENGTREGNVRATKDWSYTANRLCGENWFLAGDSAGFADPILAAGMTLAQSGAREVAYSILEIERGELDNDWIKSAYDKTHRTRILQHIRFADFWYSGNGQFTDLREYAAEIAQEAGLKMEADEAFRWLATGGFTNDGVGQVGLGFWSMGGIKQMSEMFTNEKCTWEINKFNHFVLNVDDAEEVFIPIYHGGKINKQASYRRGNNTLPIAGFNLLLIEAMKQSPWIGDIVKGIALYLRKNNIGIDPRKGFMRSVNALEVMLSENWVTGTLDETRPKLKIEVPEDGTIHKYRKSDEEQSVV